MLTVDQLARATAALDLWWTDSYGRTMPANQPWPSEELERMWAAIIAPSTDEALIAFGAVPGTHLSTREQDAENRQIMTEIRAHLSPADQRNGGTNEPR